MTKQRIIFFVFLIFAIIFSVIGWICLKNVLFNGSATTGVLIVAAIFLLLGVVLSLMVVLFDSAWLFVFSFALSFAPFFVIFGFKLAYLVAYTMGLFIILFETERALKQKRFHMKVSLGGITKPALIGIFTALALIISIVVYFSPPAQNINVEIKVPRSVFNFIINSMTNIAPSSIVSVNQILDQQTKDKIYESLNVQLNNFIHLYQRYLQYGLAVAVFLSLKTLSYIFVWIAIIVIKMIFPIMKKIGWVNIKKEMVEKEVIEIA